MELERIVVQKSNKYDTCITFLVVLNVCVCATVDCHERIKTENDLQRFVIVYFIKV